MFMFSVFKEIFSYDFISRILWRLNFKAPWLSGLMVVLSTNSTGFPQPKIDHKYNFTTYIYMQPIFYKSIHKFRISNVEDFSITI